MLLLIVIGKFVVRTAVVWLFRYSIGAAIAVASGLTQIGELSFVLVKVARSSGMVAEGVFSAVIAASLISILLNVFIVRGTLGWLRRRFPDQLEWNPRRGLQQAASVAKS
jgi:monovalent cation:H+ antiporter-2, CPA2 family